MKNKPWLPDPNTWKGSWREDWRISGQEGYLLNQTLEYRIFSSKICIEDYVDCEFCHTAFQEEKDFAYFSNDTHTWICEKCFDDFRDHFNWSVL